MDTVELSSSMKRPIAVSVFGHPFYSVSKYSLSVFKLPEKEEIDYATLDALYNDYVDDKPETTQDSSQVSEDEYSYQDSDTDEESNMWTIAITILKLLFDVLL